MDYFKDDIYWKNNIDKMIEEDFWIEDYRDLFSNKGVCLDLGCGVGQYTKKFMEYGYDVVSTDISNLALSKVKEFNPNVVCLDMREPLPFTDNSFDIVFAGLSIHYFSKNKTKELIDEIKRILKTGGLFIGSVESIKAFERMKKEAHEVESHFYYYHNQYRRLFDRNDIEEFLKDFKTIKLEEKESMRFDLKKYFYCFCVQKEDK